MSREFLIAVTPFVAVLLGFRLGWNWRARRDRR
jgi:hypothetical protein